MQSGGRLRPETGPGWVRWQFASASPFCDGNSRSFVWLGCNLEVIHQPASATQSKAHSVSGGKSVGQCSVQIADAGAMINEGKTQSSLQPVVDRFHVKLSTASI